MDIQTAGRLGSLRRQIERGEKAEILHRDQHAWAHTVSMALAFPGLRGLWPLSLISSGGIANIIAGNAGDLTYNGNPQFGNDGFVPYVDLDGVGDWLSHVDSVEFDILATEAYMEQPGLTLGAWVYCTDLANQQSIISKWGGAGNRSYVLAAVGTIGGDPAAFTISDDGTNADVVYSTSSYGGGWHFIAGRFNDADAGSELTIWLDSEMIQAATARNSIANTGSDFGVGGANGAVTLLTGKISLPFLVASAVPDELISAFYQQSRAAYGV